MKRIIALLSFIMVLTFSLRPEEHADARVDAIDLIVLIDTSLSMHDAMPAAKEFVAGELVGRIALPGDWILVMGFYGEQDILWRDDLKSEEEKASLVRSLRSLEASGRFTDIGSALDLLDEIVRQRGKPERAKYMVLVTDERQEAPYGTRYYSADYRIEHRLLEYVKRVDMGLFRVITIGYGIGERIEGDARDIMRTLSDPPNRPVSALPGASSEELAAQEAAAAQGAATAHGGGDATPAGSRSSGERGETAARLGNGSVAGLPLPVLLIGGLFLIALTAFVVLLIARSLKRERDDKDRMSSP